MLSIMVSLFIIIPTCLVIACAFIGLIALGFTAFWALFAVTPLVGQTILLVLALLLFVVLIGWLAS